VNDFLPMDVKVITSIPLCTSAQGDFWAWHYEKSRMLTVGSAYRMLVHMRERRSNWLEHTAGRSNTREDEKEWAALWKVQVPSKVRIILWWLAWRSIPMQDVRHRRNMVDNSRCSICGDSDSWKHRSWSVTWQMLSGRWNKMKSLEHYV
jgi:hypothetical protein